MTREERKRAREQRKLERTVNGIQRKVDREVTSDGFVENTPVESASVATNDAQTGQDTPNVTPVGGLGQTTAPSVVGNGLSVGAGTAMTQALQAAKRNAQMAKNIPIQSFGQPVQQYGVGSQAMKNLGVGLDGQNVVQNGVGSQMKKDTANLLSETAAEAKNTTQNPAVSTDNGTEQNPGTTINDIYNLYYDDYLAKQKELLEAQDADSRARRVERQNITISAIGDLISSFANMIGTGSWASPQKLTNMTPAVGEAIGKARTLREKNMATLDTQMAADRRQMLTARIQDLAAQGREDRTNATKANTELARQKFEYSKEHNAVTDSFKDRNLNLREYSNETARINATRPRASTASYAAENQDRKRHDWETKDAKAEASKNAPSALEQYAQAKFGKSVSEVLADRQLMRDPDAAFIDEMNKIMNGANVDKRAIAYDDIMARLQSNSGASVATTTPTPPAQQTKPKSSSSSSSTKPSDGSWKKGDDKKDKKEQKNIWDD